MINDLILLKIPIFAPRLFAPRPFKLDKTTNLNSS